MRRLALVSVLAGISLYGCSTEPVEDKVSAIPSQSEIDDAKARIGLTSDGLGRLHAALEFLGIIPVYTCGEPRSNFAGRLPEGLKTGFAGAAISLDATDPAMDRVSIVFPAAGSPVRGFKVTGSLLINTSGGQDHFSLEIDARNAQVDGKAVQSLGGYGTCGDSTSYWADSEGPLGGGDATYLFKAVVGKKSGVPVIGNTTLLVNATGSVTRGGKVDRVTLTSVDYEVGRILPRSGTILIVTSNNHRISATFSDDTPIAGQVKVKVDSKSTVTIPLPGF